MSGPVLYFLSGLCVEFYGRASLRQGLCAHRRAFKASFCVSNSASRFGSAVKLYDLLTECVEIDRYGPSHLQSRAEDRLSGVSESSVAFSFSSPLPSWSHNWILYE